MKKIKTIVSSLLITVMMLITNLTAFAATNPAESMPNDVQSTQITMTLEKALQVSSMIVCIMKICQ